MEKYFNKSDLNQLEQRYKANLINAIGGYKSANLIGTVNADGISNLCIVSSVVHLGSDPGLMGFILRPTTVPRHTYSNLLHNKSFTINQVHKFIAGRSHFTSAKFNEEESEFSELKLEAEYIDGFEAPFVKESYIKIGLRYEGEYLISNGCRLIIGFIEQVTVDDKCLNENGSLDLEAIDTIALSGQNKYYSGFFFKEFPYARKEDIDNYLTRQPKERPDNVVFNAKTKKYDSALKTYSTNVGAPKIEHQDLGNWKRVSTSKVNHYLKTKHEDIKGQYEKIVELYEWNQIIYDSKFNFEPVMGMIYHLYKSDDEKLFLSKIAPHEWKKDHQGSFKLNADRIFEKVDLITPQNINIIQ
jgi:flavin reductase (DIM6/NTAB) family NADH-FMN oxidoreductase RutF